MSITIYSAFMSILWFSAIILLGDFLRRCTGFLRYYSAGFLLLLSAASIVRLFIPLELPFTMVVRSSALFPSIRAFFEIPLFQIGAQVVSVTDMLLAVWILGSAFCFLRLFRRIMQSRKLVRLCIASHVENEMLDRLMRSIAEQTNRTPNYRLVISPLMPAPMVTGYFVPTILLPEMVLQLSEQKQRLILIHEWHHVLNKDLWIKLFVNILCCVMFWNPAVYLLRNHLEHALEVRCDLRVLKGIHSDEKVTYLETLLQALRYLKDEKAAEELPYAVTSLASIGLIGITEEVSVKQRFYIIGKYRDGLTRVTVLFTSLLCVLFLSSFLIVIQPYSEPPLDDIESTIPLGNEDSFIYIHQDGRHSLFRDGIFCELLSEEDINTPPYEDLLKFYE